MFKYLGTCITTVDDDQIWDATEMAQLIENSVPFNNYMQLQQFLPKELANQINDLDRFEFGQNNSIIWIYDSETDLHYFYKSD